jgi:cytoskeletal protein RodZ
VTTYRYNRHPHKDAKDALVVTVPATRKPTLLSDTATAKSSNRILADLERRKTYIAAFDGKRRSDRVSTLSSVLPAAIATLFAVGCAAAYFYRAPAVPASSQQGSQPTSQRITTPAAATTPLGAAAQATAAQINSATIINASASELAADARTATTREAPVPAGKGTIAVIPATLSTPARTPTHISAVAAPAAKVTATAMQPSQPTTLAGNTPNAAAITASSSSSADSDVDLLAALIARARQRDPAVTPAAPALAGSGNSSQSAATPCPMKSMDIHCLR